ncbi:MAG: hypothetical protein F6K54_25460 [Okeania sp. SIO3B5]|nr:hypothetical protein [Okeania sp. SIO3B5]
MSGLIIRQWLSEGRRQPTPNPSQEGKAGGRRFSQECQLNFMHAPMLPDMISEVKSQNDR